MLVWSFLFLALLGALSAISCYFVAFSGLKPLLNIAAATEHLVVCLLDVLAAYIHKQGLPQPSPSLNTAKSIRPRTTTLFYCSVSLLISSATMYLAAINFQASYDQQEPHLSVVVLLVLGSAAYIGRIWTTVFIGIQGSTGSEGITAISRVCR